MNNEENQLSEKANEIIIRRIVIKKEACQKNNRSLNSFVGNTPIAAMYSQPNDETIAAIKEARTVTNKISFDNVKNLMKELEKSNRNKLQIQ